MAARLPRTLTQSFAKVLRTEREARGISQEALGQLAGLHRTYVSMLERGIHSPSLAAIEALAASLKVPASKLVKAAELLQSPPAPRRS